MLCSPLNAFGMKRHNSAAFRASFLSPTTAKDSTRTGMLAGFLPACLAPVSHSALCFFQVSGSVISPSPCRPASGMDLPAFAARGWIVQLGIDGIVFSLVRNRLPRPERADDGDGFDQPFPAFVPVRPFAGGGLLVQRLARSDAEKYPAWVQEAQRCKSLSDDGRVIAKNGAC